ncbi:MAG: CPBP family intramembrane metalloprotease [Acidobacteria bacterium]|nr:CPBP family intramembrane metalloprotease [Acidobacteriota bacterium]
MSALAGSAGSALGLAGLVTAVEYFFRHYVLFWMPTLGTLRVNDMVALALAYSMLTVVAGTLAGVDWRRELAGILHALREFTTRWSSTRWILALMLSLVVLSVVDGWLWGDVRLPMWASAYRNPRVWFAPAAFPLTALAMIAVNGLLVPICEEYLWRGLIQPGFRRVLPGAAAIAVTAILFSLKHVLVDASAARFLALVAFGGICGSVAARHGWKTSAALHLFVNTITTAVSLAVAGAGGRG